MSPKVVGNQLKKDVKQKNRNKGDLCAQKGKIQKKNTLDRNSNALKNIDSIKGILFLNQRVRN